MADAAYKAFIVEGEAREPLIIDNISKIFFSHKNFKIITLPAGQNIYMLWKKLDEDDFDTDIIEVLREDHEELAEHNETENGKLYISYPMVEALRDFEPEICGKGENCYIAIDEIGNYKTVSAERAIYPQFKNYDFDIWKEAIDVFSMKISCLMGRSDLMDYELYTEKVDPYEIFKLQENEIQKHRVFILSAFPEFLVDYFGVKLWRKCARHRNRLETQACKNEADE